MAQIGTFTRDENGAYTGTIKTLTLNVKASIKPCDRDNDKAPDYRVTANGVEFGAGRSRTARETGAEFLSLKLDDPSFTAPVYASLVQGEKGDHRTLLVAMNRPRALRFRRGARPPPPIHAKLRVVRVRDQGDANSVAACIRFDAFHLHQGHERLATIHATVRSECPHDRADKGAVVIGVRRALGHSRKHDHIASERSIGERQRNTFHLPEFDVASCCFSNVEMRARRSMQS